MERILTAYQEDLLSLEELRRRMPYLRARQQNARAELQAILDQTADKMSLLRLAETLTAFLQRLRKSAATLEVSERQKIVRLLVKEVLVDDETITIRHSIPAQPTPPTSRGELCAKLGDGVNQAADLVSDAASIPSQNFTPLMIFGN